VKLRIVSNVAVAVLLAGTVGLAQEQGRVVMSEDSLAVVGQVMGSCGPASVVAQYTVTWKQFDRYDKNGVLVETIFHNSAVGSSLYYLGDEGDPAPSDAKVVIGVPKEPEIVRIDWVKNILSDQGDIFHVTVPGYGTIFAAVGHAVYDMSTDPWTTLHSTPQYAGDVAALCDYLMK
jgi:hypothetical protein